jgi:hypothetical protein
VDFFLKKFLSNDLIPPKNTTFHHLAYVARWSPTLIYFFFLKKKKKNSKNSGGPPCHIGKVVKNCIFGWYSIIINLFLKKKKKKKTQKKVGDHLTTYARW